MNRIMRNVLLSLFAIVVIISFLKIDERERPVVIDEDDPLDQSIYLTEQENGEPQSIYRLSRHFYDEVIVQKKIEEPVVVEEPVDLEPQLTSSIKYISTISKSKVKRYYFKNSGNGQIVTLTTDSEYEGWSISAIENNYFILQTGDKKYKVMKK